jgi:hypothetical protein
MRRSTPATHNTSPATPATGLPRAARQNARNNPLRHVPWSSHCASAHSLGAQTIHQAEIASAGPLTSHAFSDRHAGLVRQTGPEAGTPTQLAAPRRKAL